MTQPSTSAPRPGHRPGWLFRLMMLPFALFGMLCGAVLLALLIEWAGMSWWWHDEHHAQELLYSEMRQFPRAFPVSLLSADPERRLEEVVIAIHRTAFIETGITGWLARPEPAVAAPVAQGLWRIPDIKPYIAAAEYMVLTVLVRLFAIAFSLPLYLLAAALGLIDGLVHRDVRRLTGGRESGFIYHRARAAIFSTLTLPWLLYLVLPISIHPLWVILPGAVLFGLTVGMSAATFKKYL